VFALYAVKAEVRGRSPQWDGVVSTWTGDDPCGDTSRGPGAYASTWTGVECRGQSDLPSDAVRVVTNVHLPDYELSGPLPRSLGLLRHLRELDLDSNAFSGPLPPEWACLAQLEELDLAVNVGLTGGVPPEWGHLGRLVELELELNAGLVGCVPDGLPPPARQCGVPGGPPCPAFTLDPVVGTSTRGTGLSGPCGLARQREARPAPRRAGLLGGGLFPALRARPAPGDPGARTAPPRVPPYPCAPVPAGPLPAEARAPAPGAPGAGPVVA